MPYTVLRMKQHIPLIVLAVAILLVGAYFTYTGNKVSVETPDEVEQATTTETTVVEETASETPTPAPAAPTPVPSTPGITFWKAYANPDWALAFMYQPEWALTFATSTEGETTQVSFKSDEATGLITRDMPILEPSRLEYATHIETIAGQKVTVHEYSEPGAPYAYYLYFTIPAGGDDYHFSLKSYIEIRQPLEDFIKRITIK